MWKVTLRDIRENFGRFLMSVLAVAIGVAFLAGTLALKDLLSSTFSSLTSATVEDITISGEQVSDTVSYGAQTKPIVLDDVAGVAQIPGVQATSPAYQMMNQTFVKDGGALNVFGAPSYVYNFSAGIDEARLSTGKAPERGQAVVELSTATRNELEVGDSIVIFLDKPTEFEISGILEFGSGMAGAGITFINEDEIIDYLGDNPVAFFVDAEDGTDLNALKADIEAELGDAYTVKTASEVQAETKEMIDSILTIVNTFILVFVAIALGISTFIISNTFTISVRQRQKQFALLRAMGASPQQVFSVVLLQAIVIGIIGSILGVILGQGLVTGLRALIESTGMPLSGAVVITGKTALISIGIGLLVTILATVIPSRKAALTPPIEAMRDSGGQQEKPLKVRGSIGAGMLAAGVAAVAIGATKLGAGALFGVGAALLFVGVIVVMPALVGPMSRIIGWPAQKFAPATGTLAVRSLNAAPRKTATTTVAFAIGVALVTAGATIASSLQATTGQMVDDNLKLDVALLTNGGVDDAEPTVDLVKKADGVSDAYNLARLGLVVATVGDEEMTVYVGAPDPRSYDALGTVFLEGSPQALDAGEAIVVESWAKNAGVSIGDTITMTGETGTAEVKIGAITQDAILVMGGQDVDVSRKVFDSMNPLQQSDFAVVVLPADGANVADVKQNVQDIVADQYIWTVVDNEAVKGIASSQVNTMVTMLYMLLGLSIVISILGIINTLTLSVVDRIKEIGLLRAVGMQRGGVRKMVTIESLITTFVGLIVGVILGLILGIALVRFMASDQEATYVIPWLTIAIMVVVAFIVGLIAAILPARKAARMDVLDAIATE